MKTLLIYIAAWFGMVPLAILNGIIREKFYGPSVSELSAHQLSTLIALVLFGIYIFYMVKFFPMNSSAQALFIGGMWITMTICFEFLFGHYVVGHPWSKLLHDYNIMQGRVWILVLVWTFFAPYVFYKIRSE
ncbi:MAG: hypothetical protein DWQ10_12720 [Calditrichaeota bacterium]|nr:MAG: hypothetical protein DWQ10_12720 [Calditrichota bacterium]